YLIAFLLLLFTIFCSVRLRDSRLGRAWIAIREDETAAAAMGVPLMRTKTWAYAQVFVRISGTPIAAAAVSSSRIAIHARPRRESRSRTEQKIVKRSSRKAIR